MAAWLVQLRPRRRLPPDAPAGHEAPGIYVIAERAGQSASPAVSIHANLDITLGGNLANTLRLTCDNPEAILTIGAHVELHAFVRSNVRCVGFASLMTALEACEGHVTIHYRGSTSATGMQMTGSAEFMIDLGCCDAGLGLRRR
jgi:hypothetical protein